MRLPIFLALLLSLMSTSTTFAFSLPLVNSLALSNLTLPRLEAYEPKCVKIEDPPMTGLNPTNCANLAHIICTPLTYTKTPFLVRDKWVWRERPGCALAFYLPEHTPVPSMEVCVGLIFGEMVEMCAMNSRFNGGAINVDELPSFGSNGTVVKGGEARFLMAPERMTL